MVFKKMLGVLGLGAPSVDTVLSNPNTQPGLVLNGQVNLVGGSRDVTIEHVTVGLVTRVEIESEGGEHDGLVEFHRVTVAGGLRLREGERVCLPLQVPVPWETPVTDVYGQRLHGMTMGLRTEVAISGAVDKGDLDPVFVHPLPVQERILAAFDQLGFRFKGADLEAGSVYGLPQSLPFYQEIEFFPPAQYAHSIADVELTFVTTGQNVEVVLEFDKRAGMFTRGHDSVTRYRVAHCETDSTDWVAQVDSWMRQAIESHQARLSTYSMSHGYGAPGYPTPLGYSHDSHHDQGHGHGSGVGGVVAGAIGGAALGFAGGMVAEEVFDAFGDDEEPSEAEEE